MLNQRVDALLKLIEGRAANAEHERGEPLSDGKLSALGVPLPETYRQVLATVGTYDDEFGFNISLPDEYGGPGPFSSLTRNRTRVG